MAGENQAAMQPSHSNRLTGDGIESSSHTSGAASTRSPIQMWTRPSNAFVWLLYLFIIYFRDTGHVPLFVLVQDTLLSVR